MTKINYEGFGVASFDLLTSTIKKQWVIGSDGQLHECNAIPKKPVSQSPTFSIGGFIFQLDSKPPVNVMSAMRKAASKGSSQIDVTIECEKHCNLFSRDENGFPLCGATNIEMLSRR